MTEIHDKEEEIREFVHDVFLNINDAFKGIQKATEKAPEVEWSADSREESRRKLGKFEDIVREEYEKAMDEDLRDQEFAQTMLKVILHEIHGKLGKYSGDEDILYR